MKTEYTEDGYFKISADEKEILNYDEIPKMNTTTYILPSFRDRYEKNSILFHKGDYISFKEYLKIYELDFVRLQKIIARLTDIYIGMEQNGFKTGNVLPFLDCIFMNEKSEDIKVIYIPIITEIEEEGFHTLLKNICNEVQTKGAAILLGTLLEEANRKKCNLSGFKAEVEAVKNTSEVKEVEKIVEKIVEIPIEKEKIIEKEVRVTDSRVFCMVAIITELITRIMLPILLYLLFGNYVSVMPQASTYILLIFTIIVLILTNYMIGRNKTPSNTNSFTKVEKKSTEQTNTSKPIISEKSGISEKRQPKEKKQKNISPQNIEKEVSEARIVRDDKKDDQKVHRNNLYKEADDEGTAVLFGSDPLNEAYIIEEGKTGLMDRIFIDCDNFIIGREQGVNYKIEETSVSKKHAEIRCIGGEYFIRDLNSSNGTSVNNMKIKSSTDMKLSDGSRLEFGNKKYMFCRK